VSEAAFPGGRAQVDAAREAFTPAVRGERGRSFLGIEFAEDRFIGACLKLRRDRVVEAREQDQHAFAQLRVEERCVQDFRQPLLRLGQKGADRERGQETVHAIE